MASDSLPGVRVSGKQSSAPGFHWVAPSPSPETVKRLEERFPEVVLLPEEEMEAETDAWSQSAVIARTYQRWVPAEAFLREFRRAGVLGEIQAVSMAFRCHVFRFASLDARDLVLNRPWIVNGQAAGTEAWHPEFTPADDAVASIMVWVRLPNLPLEFWRVEFIKEILASAGQFVCVDAATMAKNRGAFARACIRVDLNRPLRPGSRIQGLKEPFWQQFSYENLQGICNRCGSLHLGVPCSVSEVEGADEGVFGPWIAAVRQRNHPQGAPTAEIGRSRASSSSGGSKSQSDSQRMMARSDGWQLPKHVARRRQPPSSPATVNLMEAQSGLDPLEGSEKASGTVKKLEKGKRAVFATVSKPLSAPSRELNLGDSTEVTNPFASLRVEPSLIGADGSRDARPGPLKRSRPESYPDPRPSHSTVKGKGKGKSAMTKVGAAKSGSSHGIELSPSCQVGGLMKVGTEAESGVGVCQVDLDPMGMNSNPRELMQDGLSDSGGFVFASPSASLRRMTVDGPVVEKGHAECTMVVDQGEARISPNL